MRRHGRWVALPAVLTLLAASAARSTQGAEILDAAELGGRGFTLVNGGDNYESYQKVGEIGDVDRDGFDDLGVAFQAPRGGDVRRFAIVYGRHDMAERVELAGLERMTVFGPGTFTSSIPLTGAEPLGDLDGDGFADFSLGTFYDSIPVAVRVPRAVQTIVFGSDELPDRLGFDEIGSRIRGIRLYASDPLLDTGGQTVLLGDFNGDGEDDLLVTSLGASLETADSPARRNVGVAFVVFGARNLPADVDLSRVGTEIPGVRITGDFDDSNASDVTGVGSFGTSVAPIGDSDGDGLADFLIAGSPSPRFAYLFRGGDDYPPVLALHGISEGDRQRLRIVQFSGSEFGLHLRGRLAGLGDLNGDGMTEFAIGASYGGFNPEIRERVHVFYGGARFSSHVDLHSLEAREFGSIILRRRPGIESESFGWKVAGPGDLNGDGVPDLVMSATHTFVGELRNAGEVAVLYNTRSLPESLELADGFDGILLQGAREHDNLGVGIAPAGDFNGDGHRDLVVTNIRFTLNPGPQEAHVIYGLGPGGPPFRALDVRPDFGALRGGLTVQIRGSAFEDGMAVLFGGRPASSVTVVSSGTVQAVVPPGEALGRVDVEVRRGGASTVLSDAFEYIENLPPIDVADLGLRGVTFRGEPLRRVGEHLALGDLTGDGAAELAMTYILDGFKTEDPHRPWSVVIAHGGERLEGTVDVSQPRPGLSWIETNQEHRFCELGIVDDVSGDGLGDLLINVGDDGSYLFFGRAQLLSSAVIEEEVAQGRAAHIVLPGVAGTAQAVSMGDLTGDGIAELLIAYSESPCVQLPGRPCGEILIVEGQTAWPAEVDLSASALVVSRMRSARVGEDLGVRLASVGDVNDDGFGDVLIGTASFERAYLLFGSDTFLSASNDFEVEIVSGGGMVIEFPQQAILLPAGSPARVARCGDVNGDGIADLFFGLTGAGTDFEGRSYLYHGRRDLPPVLTVPNPEQVEAALADEIIEFVGPGGEAEAGLVAPGGDFNSDGFADLLIGSPGPITTGSLFIVFGDAELPKHIELAEIRDRGLRLRGSFELGNVEIRIKETGDFDGDGVSDVVFSERGLEETSGATHMLWGYSGEERFIRGDASFDGAVDISDAVFTLGYLFLGGPQPFCQDAADSDDSGSVDISDPVRTLDYLFRGGVTIPAPFPQRGDDPTADALGCLGF